MPGIAAKNLNAALFKAKNIGLVEESFILQDCELTLRNLRPDEYLAVLQACQGLDSEAYLNAYQLEHISRSIVVINGADLHDVKYVEEEEPDPKNPEKLRTIKLELHAYLNKHVVSTWSKEAIYTAYRKFTDVIEKAERKAKEGITFLLPEETNEEKYRRLLLEAKECEGDLPDSLIDHVLDELGFMRKTTAEEIKAAMERTDQLARAEEASKGAPETPVSEPFQEVSSATEPVVPNPQVISSGMLRQPLNQPVGRIPVDPHQSLQQAIEARRAPVNVSVAQPTQEESSSNVPLNRAAKIAALEVDAGMADIVMPGKDGDIPIYQQLGNEPIEVVEVRKQAPVDPNAVGAILDQPPRSGINPRFRSPAKL